jgi:hypothetical protein
MRRHLRVPHTFSMLLRTLGIPSITAQQPLYLDPNPSNTNPNLVEETKDLASNVLPAGLLVVHDTGRGGEHDEAELTRGE